MALAGDEGDGGGGGGPKSFRLAAEEEQPGAPGLEELEAGHVRAEVAPEAKMTSAELEAADEAMLGNSIDFGEWADARKSRELGAKRTPKDTSVFGRAFLTWMYGLVFKGFRKPLQKEDLPGLNPDYLSSKLYMQFQEHFNADPTAKHAFQRALLRIPKVRHTLILGSILSATQGVLATVGRPLILKIIVEAVENDVNTVDSIILIIKFAAIVGIEGWAGVLGRQLLAEEFGTQFQICASSAVYSKMLRVDTQRQYEDQASESSLIGNDVVRAYENLRIAAQLPMAVSSVIGGVVVLILLIGKSALVGIGIMLAILCLNVLMGKITHSIEQKNLRFADERLSILTAVVEGIRAVKLFGWEEKYRKKINDIRDEECTHIRNYRLAHVTSIASGRASPVLSAMATLVFYAIGRDSVDLADAYAAVSVFQALRLGLIFVPLCMTAFLAVDVTIKRLNIYFRRPDKADRVFLPMPEPGSQDPVVQVERCSLGWIADGKDDSAVLRDVAFSVQPGEIVAIVGGVGEGKSTLLASVAQAIAPLSRSEGRAPIRTVRSVGFAPQKPFVVCGTLKQNVLLGRPFDQVRFDRALFASGMHADIAALPGGIYTEVGERGTTLSGGQQARMAVARSLYAEPTLLCFDDILAAVDAKMCAHMFEHAILKQVQEQNRACVVAMNQLALLPRVSRILYISEGTVSASGTYNELLESCPAFADFVECTKLLQEESVEDTALAQGGNEPEESPARSASNSHVEEASEVIRESSKLYDGFAARLEDSRLNDDEESLVSKTGKKGTILGTEQLTRGKVNKDVYFSYFKAIGPFFMLLSLTICLSGYVMMAVNDYWLTRWAEAMEDPNETRGNAFFAGVYVALSLGFGSFIMTTSWMLCFGGVRASRTLHHTMLRRLLRAPLEWFEGTSTGRIMSRFSGDLSKVDMMLSLIVDNATQILATLLVQLGVICYAVPIAAVVIVVVAVLFSVAVVAADRASRETRRIANSNMSPLLSNAAEATRGRDVVAVMETGPFFEARHRLASDEYARANFVAGSIINWSQLISHYLSFTIAVFSTLMLVVLRDVFGGSDLLALVIVYCVNLPYFAAMLSQITIRMNSYFTSYERLLEYETLEEEESVEEAAVQHQPGLDPKPPASVWPTSGAIEFRDVQLRYRPTAPLVLKGVSFTVQGGESLGICGKTGAGKSSTISCLFRLRPISGGAVMVDGRDVGTVDLNVLRSRITIIPQDPVLISGTLATNLDPFGEVGDAEMLEALQIVGLGQRVSLDDPVEASGRNWSAGERQLICFARALLRPNKVLVLDEPSSAIDLNTDDAIHEMVREQFYRRRRCSVLCIAHRLQTIATYDKIAVMQDGRVLEIGSPTSLLNDATSELHSMVESLGPASRQHINDLAARAEEEKKTQFRPSMQHLSRVDLGLAPSSPAGAQHERIDERIDEHIDDGDGDGIEEEEEEVGPMTGAEKSPPGAKAGPAPRAEERPEVEIRVEAESGAVAPEMKVTAAELAAADEAMLGNSVDVGEWADARKSRAKGAEHTFKDTSVLGRAFLTWMYGIVFKGFKKPLRKDDLPGLNPDYISSSLYLEFQEHFNTDPTAKHAFQRALLRIPRVRNTLILGTLISVMQGILSTVAKPLILKVIVDAVAEDVSTPDAIVLIVYFALIVGAEGWAGVMARQLLAEEFGTMFHICASSAVYGKMLRVDTQRQYEDQSSESSLIGNDIVRAYENLRFAAKFPMAIAGVIGGVAVLLVLIGTSALVGIAIMLGIMALNMLLGKLIHMIEEKNLMYADERLSMLNTVVEGIRAVKLFGWEEKYRKKISDVRDSECVYIRNFRIAQVTSIASARASPVLASMATMIFYVFAKGSVDLADAYAAISVFQALRLGLISVPLGFTSLMAFDVTLKRLNVYFRRPDKAERVFLPTPGPESTAPIVEVKQCSLGWVSSSSNESAVLRDVAFTVQPGEIVAIVGGVGEGKSTLLSSVAQAIAPLTTPGESTPIRTVKSVGYAPQKPFVVCGTLKQNVLLGRPFDQLRFDRALFASGLQADIPGLPGGIYTEIGERGTTLSGGQQARMAVARSLYAEPTLLCFDDILAAVDAKMCAHMFEHAILRQVQDQNRACVVAMNQLALLPRVSRILYISNGTVSAIGTYDELLESSAAFADFVECTKLLQEETEEDAAIVQSAPSTAEDTLRKPLQEAEDAIRASSQLYDGFDARVESAPPSDDPNDDDDDVVAKGGKGSLLRTEELTRGRVDMGVYFSYFRAIGLGYLTVAQLIGTGGYVMMAVNDAWLTRWAEALEDPDNTQSNAFYAGIYAALGIGFGSFIMIASWMMSFGGVRASRRLHHTMLGRLVSAPLSWFEGTSTGRIMSRFSGDLSKVDNMLSLVVDSTIQQTVGLIVQLGVICYSVPIAAVIVVAMAVIFYFATLASDRTSRESRRIANSSMSPLLSNATEATRGRDVAAVMETGPFFEARHRLASDEYARANYVAGSIINWSQLVTHYMSFTIAVFATLILVVLRDSFGDSDLLALVIAYCVNLPYFASILAQNIIRMNSFFTSYERLIEYETLEEEDAVDKTLADLDPKPPASEWPSKGAIEFRDVQLRYRPNAPLVLKGVTFTVQGGESLGICGRTGAGKSSTISCLFRLRPISGGAVMVDGRDISTVDLTVLRSRITIIPQDPVLISGTLATNLDPFGETDDEAMREALRIVGLGESISLEDPVEASGRNWSAGERQLICFARALLRPNKVLVLDEPSSAIDLNTDDAIHEMVREQFYRRRRCSVLCIAHRLQTIATYDKIAVMQDGRVLEMGSPTSLLGDASSELHSMVESLGPASRQHINDLAARAEAEKTEMLSRQT
ncbi:ABC transporter, putative [Hondaea fermentalgiana]|uniref:ABC transporter, putative n=1 Tax=Hondaea fermentalgiana TaxID=2315210 RepID=A0A2R5GRP8_9STRA|nr:ABC transporter, putative [Hondaea fermentalgiana]|eukprot:GBG31313.1 ABC transporter, putative [Hondaea fermentalgiana]